MNSSNKRTLSILLALALFASAIFIYSSLIKPLYPEIFSLRSKALNLDQNLNSYTSLNKDFQSLLEEFQNLGDLENQLAMVLPRKLNPDYVVNQIAGLAKTNNLEIQSLSLKELAIKPSAGIAKGIGTVQIGARFSGTYEIFKSFIKNLEENIMIADIVEFEINQGTDNKLTYNMSINAYYQAE
ncbi:hypothetical protein HZB04_03645 [Candidatus Wolfebacteria bacterium]|nr:hypothetical protein [Candidatus Wolfebacteria bacterium]